MSEYDTTTAIVRTPQAGMSVRQEASGGQEISVTGDVNQTQIVAESRARIESEHIIAKRFPRDIDLARTRILADCKRPRFAEKARYSKPTGKDRIEGPSIRFVESAVRAMGNTSITSRVTYDDFSRRKIEVTVRDLETNTPYTSEIIVDKTVERRSAKGREVLASRTNAYGDTLYIVVATEDEMLMKQGALVSKAIRTLGLRLIPHDIVEEAMDAVLETQSKKDAEDPDAARKKLVDAFVGIGVKPDALKAYLGHDVGASSPAEMADLRAIYVGIHGGETTWKEVVESVNAEPGEDGKKAPSVVDKIKDKLSKRKQTHDPETGEVTREPGQEG